MRRALLLLALAFPFASAAQTFTEGEKLSGWSPKAGGGFERNIYNPLYQSSSRAIVPYTGGARASTSATLTGPAGPLSVIAHSNMSNKAIGVAAAKYAARALPTVAVGVALWDIWDNIMVRPDGAGGLAEDAGQPPQEIDNYTCQVGANHKFTSSSVLGACSQSLDSAKATYTDPYFGTNKVWTTTSSCQTYVDPLASSGACSRNFNAGGAGQIMIVSSWTKTKKTECPAVVDFSNPALSKPAGLPAGPDGKCPTGRYDRPLSFQQAGDKFAAYPPSDPSSVARDVIQNGESIEATPAGIQGPASQTGQPTTRTTTNPDGTVKTETKTPTYSYNYSPSSFTWNISNSTTINNNGQTTTINEDSPPDDVVGATDPALGEVPELYTQKYPDGLAGVWAAESAAMRNTPIFQFLASLNPGLGDGGCPVWGFPAGNVLGINVGGDISVPCYVWSAVRVIFVISALLLARRLIFGG